MGVLVILSVRFEKPKYPTCSRRRHMNASFKIISRRIIKTRSEERILNCVVINSLEQLTYTKLWPVTLNFVFLALGG